MKRPLLVVLACVLLSACGGNSSPTNPSPTPTPTTSRVLELGGSLAFGSVEVGSTKDLNFSIANRGNANLTITGLNGPSGYQPNWTSGVLAPNGVQIVTVRFSPTAVQSYNGVVTVIGDQTSGTNTIAISGAGIGPPFTRSGIGNTVFDLPSGITRIHVTADFRGFCQNFIVHVGGRSVVNEILGSCSVATTGTHYDGIHLVSGTTVEVMDSTGVSWSITEQR